MHTNSQQTRKLLREYTSLASTYDQRWSAYIDASLSMTLQALAGLPADNVLDVACGTGTLLELLAGQSSESTLVGIDRVPAMLAVAEQRIGHRATLLEGEAEELPFDDNSFCLITNTNALHYFVDEKLALQEMRRVLAPSGNLIITDWCRDYFWMKLLNRILPRTRHAHSHTFSSAELEQCLISAGFRVVSKNTRKIDGFWALMTIHATTN